MEFTPRTDLACESDAFHDGGKTGTEYKEETIGGVRLARLAVTNAAGEAATGKKRGRYVTLFSAPIWELSDPDFSDLSARLEAEIRAMTEAMRPAPPKCVLVAGLGNREITADNLGPLTVDKLTVTRHIKAYDRALFDRICSAAVCAIAPGVVGQTGMETAELLASTCQSAKPDLLLVIDALAARDSARLGATVQISDSGICPGSGVGNHRREISRETLGIPVLAVGVPTVVSSATLVYDALQKAGKPANDPAIETVLRTGESFFVSPRECDRLSARVSDLLSAAIDNLYLEGAVSC